MTLSSFESWAWGKIIRYFFLIPMSPDDVSKALKVVG